MQAKMRSLGGSAATLSAPPADLAAFERWNEEFEVLAHINHIEHLLAEQEALRESYAELVPAKMSYRAFWARYYEERVLQQQEERRFALLRRNQEIGRTGSPGPLSLSSWEDQSGAGDGWDDDGWLGGRRRGGLLG